MFYFVQKNIISPFTQAFTPFYIITKINKQIILSNNLRNTDNIL